MAAFLAGRIASKKDVTTRRASIAAKLSDLKHMAFTVHDWRMFQNGRLNSTHQHDAQARGLSLGHFTSCLRCVLAVKPPRRHSCLSNVAVSWVSIVGTT